MPIVIPKNELNEFSLPRVCVATGRQGEVTYEKVQFQYFPKWIAIFAIAPLLYLIFFMLLRKSANGTMPFSPEAWAEVKAARRNVALAAVGFFALLMLGGFAAARMPDVGFLVFLVALVGGIVALGVTASRVRKVFPVATLIDNAHVTLKLPSLEAERIIEQHLSSGAKQT